MDAESKTYIEEAIAASVAASQQTLLASINALTKKMDEIKDDKKKINVPDFVGGTGGLNDGVTHVSVQSFDSDVKIINAITKPKFTNADSQKKIELDNLRKLQSKALARIPKLSFSEALNPNSSAPPLHNYGIWYRSLINYLNILSPPLAEKIQGYVTSINVDDIMSGNLHVPVPELDEWEFPLVTRLDAFGAITDTLSSDFMDYVETEQDGTTANMFVTMCNLSVFCAPNSHQDRADHISEFWSSNHLETECITKFQRRMEKAARDINNQYSRIQITPEQLYAATIAGIRKGGQFAAYQNGLNSLKISSSTSRNNIKSRVLWLYNMCDREKLPQSFLQTSTVNGTNSASMARVRGGRYGGGGKGRGGRGGKGKGKGNGNQGNDNQRPIPGATWDDSVYLVTDADGDDQVAKKIAERKSNQVCFSFVKFGKCKGYPKGDCPYNHQFKVVDTRKNNNSSSAPNPNSVPTPPTVSAADPTPDPPASDSAVNVSNNISNFIDQDADYDSAFDYGNKLGFSCGSAVHVPKPSYSTNYSTNYLYSTLTNTTTFYNAFEFVFMLWFLCCSLPYLCASFVVLLGSFVSMSVSVSYSIATCLVLCFDFLLNFVSIIFSMFVQPIGLVAENTFYATNLIGSYISNSIFSLILSPLTSVSSFLNSISSLLTSFPILCFAIGVAVVCFRLNLFIPHLASAASVRRAVYKIILDCGCSFTMSGDLGLFIQSTLTPINESVGLAESGKSARATHKGKMVVDGKVLDALYVPDFKQTMISMGQLERMGLVYTKVSENSRSFLTDRGDVFMSFFVAPNNLYPLLPTSQSASSGTTEESS
jgi:hypothetical protein